MNPKPVQTRYSKVSNNIAGPDDFCDDKEDGTFANPNDNKQFLTCKDKKRDGLCLSCPATLVFINECGECKRVGESKSFLSIFPYHFISSYQQVFVNQF